MISNTPDSALTHFKRQLKLRLKQNRVNIVAALLTIFLHILLLQATAISNWHVMPLPHKEHAVQINLLPNIEARGTPPPAISPPPLKKQESQSAPKPRQPVLDQPLVVEEKSEAIEDFGPSTPITDIPPERLATLAKPSPEPEPETNPDPATSGAYALSLPDPVELKMALLRTEPDSNRAPIYGVGSIVWAIDGDTYKLSIEAGLDVLFTSINLYRLTSEGGINSFGLAPELSTEARRTRAKTATHFHNEDKTVSFSASSAKLAIQDGAQDKASFLMQLASIGKGDPSQFVAGKEITLQVAEEKELSIFVFKILEQEEISTKLGKFRTWHLVRAARPGSYSSQLEIWLAPSTGWYPIQIRNTESNGTVTTQSVTEIIQKNLPPH